MLRTLAVAAAVAVGWVADIVSSKADTSTGSAADVAVIATEDHCLHLAAVRVYLNPATSLHRAAKGPLTHPGYYVVQLDGPASRERRYALARYGVNLGQYLPTNAFIVQLQAGFDPLPLSGVSCIRWLGAFETAWKLDPLLGRREFQTESRRRLADAGRIQTVVTLFEGEAAEPIAAVLKRDLAAEVHGWSVVAGNATLRVTLPSADVYKIANLEAVQFVEEAPEITARNDTTRWIVQSNVAGVTPLYNAGITGAGQIVGVIDDAIDANHCSFRDTLHAIGPTHRKIVAYNAAAGADLHGTHVACTAVGDNGDDSATRGVAYGARLVYSAVPSFTETDIYTTLSLHHTQGARVHNSSWGDAATTNYNGLCRGIDAFAYDHEDSLVCQAIADSAAIKNPENAKNLLAVGATQDTPFQGNWCTGGLGPTADQRRRPEIFAPGCGTNSALSGTACGVTAQSGTSMACAAISGAALLARQFYTDGYYPTGAATPANALVPSAALVKATLLNSAVDMTGIAGYPNNQEGWGRVLADNALYFPGDARKLLVLADVRNSAGRDTGQSTDYGVHVDNASQPLRVTLAWTDPPAASNVGGGPAAVNDLDLVVIAPNSQVYRGNAFSAGVSVPGGVSDNRNNVEQILINSPMLGAWTIRVSAAAVNQGLQGYALVATGGIVAGPPPMSVTLPAGAPSVLPPMTPTSFAVRISPGSDTLVAGSPKLFYRFNNGAFQFSPLVHQSGELYTATIPPAACSAAPQFYLSAEGVVAGVITQPPAGEAGPLTAVVGTPVSHDVFNFQSAPGWTVSGNAVHGMWALGTPIGCNRGDPPTDYDASGMCFLTEPSTSTGTVGCDTDVDSGSTTLTSPVFDLTGMNDPSVNYARWYSNATGTNPQADQLSVEVSSDGGAGWISLETVGPTASSPHPEITGGWFYQTYRIADSVALTSQFRIQFTASDLGAASTVEAGIDAFSITEIACSAAGCTRGDVNGDGVINGRDIARFSAILIHGGGTAAEICAGDVQPGPNGAIDLPDVPGFVACVLAGGC